MAYLSRPYTVRPDTVRPDTVRPDTVRPDTVCDYFEIQWNNLWKSILNHSSKLD